VSASAWHLVARFFGSLLPRRMHADDAAWVASLLTPTEQSLWARMPRVDRIEGIAVARRADQSLPAGLEHREEYLAAALLHDAGKIDADLGPIRRAVATLAGALGARSMMHAWKQRRGFARRCALYLDHPVLGEQRVRVLGGRERVAQWAAAHHAASTWPTPDIPLDVCVLLAQADGERVRDADACG
jgi:hypothetical protein